MPQAPRPLIAISGSLEPGESPRLSLATRYADALLRAGGVPVAIPPVGGPGDVARLLERVDGILIAGGDDFDTARLGLGPTHPAARPVPRAKQDFDFELARRALAVGLPILGICYGMQVLGLVEGGGLFQHLPEDRPGRREHAGGASHPVELAPEGKLAGLLDVPAHDVISRHHQALSRVGAGWSVSARDDEGLIEGIERSGHPFAIGVQWHPESAAPGGADDRLFRGLVSASSLSAAMR